MNAAPTTTNLEKNEGRCEGRRIGSFGDACTELQHGCCGCEVFCEPTEFWAMTDSVLREANGFVVYFNNWREFAQHLARIDRVCEGDAKERPIVGVMPQGFGKCLAGEAIQVIELSHKGVEAALDDAVQFCRICVTTPPKLSFWQRLRPKVQATRPKNDQEVRAWVPGRPQMSHLPLAQVETSRVCDKKKRLHSPEVTPRDDVEDQLSCKVCFDEPMNIILQPCRHVGMCKRCAKDLHLQGRLDKCPWCHHRVSYFEKCYLL